MHPGLKTAIKRQQASGKELFSSGAGNTLALPLELEQNQFVIGFKVWSGTFLQPSMNQSYSVEAEWVLANICLVNCFVWVPCRTESTHAMVSHQVTVLCDVVWTENSERRKKNLQGERSKAFTNMLWGWTGLQGWKFLPVFLSTWAMVSKEEKSPFLQKRGS